MLVIEYDMLLEYINSKLKELDYMTVYRVHSVYDPHSRKVCKVTLKIIYTNNHKPLPADIGEISILPRYIHMQQIAFKGKHCNREHIEKWIHDFIEEKRK